ncbi:MAG: T9SS type A sorting domain-containing protein [Bacteroidota bacterium]
MMKCKYAKPHTWILLCCLCYLVQISWSQSRDCEVVVMEGMELNCLLGTSPDSIVGFKFENNIWTQIPIQIDERRLVDIAIAYGPYDCLVNSTLDTPWQEYFYCDTATFTGADTTDLLFDLDDELSFMTIDVGTIDSLDSCPMGVREQIKCRVAVTDPLENDSLIGYIYLFEQDGSLQQDAGIDYVDYDYDDFGGDYKNNYNVCIPGQPMSNPNPELSTVNTDQYSMRYTGRWINDRLKIKADTATNENILDTHQYFMNPSANALCTRSETGFSWKNGAIIANIDGPIRGIRSTMGAQSAPFMHLEIVYTRCRTENRFSYRIHPSIGYYEVRDLTNNATGMYYYSNQDTSGVVVDGIDDDMLNLDEPNEWALTVGAPGAIADVYRYQTNMQLGTRTQFDNGQAEAYVGAYHSDQGDDEPRTCTGDKKSYGSNGFYLLTELCTDRRDTDTTCQNIPRYFEQQRYSYYLPPHTTITEAVRYAEFVDFPLNATSESLACIVPTCNDGIKNGDEIGIDCGGSFCGDCTQFCVDTTLTDALISGFFEFQNFQSITTDMQVDSLVEVNLAAADYVLLQAGFHAKKGSNLSARITDCIVSLEEENRVEEREEIIAHFDFDIYPNPAHTELTISTQNADNEIFELIFYTINGQLVKREQLSTQVDNLTLDIADLKDGIYYLQLKGQDTIQTKRLIIQH